MARHFVQVMEKAGVMPGIKVDTGAHPLAGHPGEKVTEGLDGLRARLEEYRGLGAPFRQVARGDHHWRQHPHALRASTPTRTRWRGMRHCARKPASCRSSSPRC
jgi:hypothetical protein